MFECYSMLSALAQHTERVRLSALVTGKHLPEPSPAREDDHHPRPRLEGTSDARNRLRAGSRRSTSTLGFEFGTLHRPLREARGGAPDHRSDAAGRAARRLEGKHYKVVRRGDQLARPALGKIPIMIGGQGEKKTLRMVAQYADESNLTGTVEDIREARGARRALRATRPRSQRDQGDQADDGLRGADDGGGAGRPRSGR